MSKKKKKLNGFQSKQQRNFIGNTREITEHLKKSNNKEMFYHITKHKNWRSIQKQGLKGGVKDHYDNLGGRENSFKLKGKLFFLDTKDKRVWNGVSCNEIQQHRLNQVSSRSFKNWDRKESRERNIKYLDRKSIKNISVNYVVIGIPKELFRFLGITIYNDPTIEVINYDNNHKFVSLGNKSINPKFLSVVYNGVDNLKKHNQEEVWDIKYETLKKSNPSIKKEDISIINLMGDEIPYKERHDKILNNSWLYDRNELRNKPKIK